VSIHFVKSKGAYCFSFKRVINGERVRATKLLPKAWSQAQVHAYDLKESARLYELHSGLVAHSRPTIEAAILVFLEGRAPELKCYKGYEQAFARLYPLYEGKYIDELAEVCKAINKLKLAASSRRRNMAVLCSACNYAYKFHKMGSSKPSANVQFPVVRDSRELHPERKEMLQLARKAKRKEVRAAILTAFYSGMRRAEIIRAVIDGDVFKLFDTKNGRMRFIPIHHKLNPYRKEFPMTMTIDALSGAFTRVRAKTELKHFRFHDLRHSTATELINSGADLNTVGMILGHLSPISTKRYAHLLISSLDSAMQKIGIGKKRQT
jgi:integrase